MHSDHSLTRSPRPRGRSRSPTMAAVFGIVTSALLATVTAAAAQETATVVPAFAADEWLSSDGALEFRVSGDAASNGSRVAVFVGSMDVTALTRRDGETFRYDPRVVPLPAGEHDVTVYGVDAVGAWSEIGRIPIRVLTPRGFERIAYDPGLSIENAGQLAEGHSLDQLAPERDTYQDFTFRTGFLSEHVRPGLTFRTQINAVGASNRQQALRFGSEQDDAPKFDLADYVIRAESQRGALSVGHVSVGTDRHLINGFASRGIAFEAHGGPLSAKLAALNGSSIVGWHNPLGLGQSGHRILAGEIGIDALANRAGTLQLNATFVDGSVLPVTGFNEGAIVDAETSRGVGLQLSASDPGGRLQLNGGFARSQYDDAEDVTITRGSSLVIIHQDTRDARYLDASLDVLRGLRLGETTVATLTTAFRHERVEPLFRSVAAFTQSDIQENAFDVTAAVGPVSARYGHGLRSDNLDAIPSILTTRTSTDEVSLALPLGVVVGMASSTLLPQLSYSLNRVHQAGEGVPENGGFSASHVPDQLSTVHGLTAEWYRSIWRLMYRLDSSTQDNRQEGREDADFRRRVHTVTLGVNPRPALGLSVDGSIERDTNSGSAETSEARQLAVSANIQVAGRTALAVSGSQAWTKDPFDEGADRVVRQFRVELSQGLELFARESGATTGQFFVRFAHQRGDLFGLSDGGPRPAAWTVNTGFNLSLF